MNEEAGATVFAVRYEYAEGSDASRDALRPAHVHFLEGLHGEGALVVSGRLEERTSPGALLVLRADSKQDAGRILDSDPFWSAGVIGERDIGVWDIVFGKKGIIA